MRLSCCFVKKLFSLVNISLFNVSNSCLVLISCPVLTSALEKYQARSKRSLAVKSEKLLFKKETCRPSYNFLLPVFASTYPRRSRNFSDFENWCKPRWNTLSSITSNILLFDFLALPRDQTTWHKALFSNSSTSLVSNSRSISSTSLLSCRWATTNE